MKTKIGLWKGKEIEKLTKKELYEVIKYTGKLLDELQTSFHSSTRYQNEK